MSIQDIINKLTQEISRARRARDRRAAQLGFSLIEVMIAMVVSGIVLVGVFAFSGVTSATSTAFTRGVKVQQGLEAAMASMGNDIRLAGLGFAPMCSEVRVYGNDPDSFVNPTSGYIPDAPGARDPHTQELYWVLRDGFQAHWRSSTANGGGGNMFGDPDQRTSAALGNAADSFDVAFGEPGFVASQGAFVLFHPVNTTPGFLVMTAALDTPNRLVNTNQLDLNSVRQLFPPGSFVLLMSPSAGPNAADSSQHMQCALVQVTNEVNGWQLPQQFAIPTEATSSFNASLNDLVSPSWIGGMPDSAKNASLNDAGTIVVPMGRFRWSRYEIDYTVPTLPYLVRTDLISWVEGDPVASPTQSYPGCGEPLGGSTQCKIPQLHLPTSNVQQSPPAMRVPIAPMIEDMQVAVGCDPVDATALDPPGTPSLSIELGQRLGLPNDNVPNRSVDEFSRTNERSVDEWVGNALSEEYGPDCVYWGSGQSLENLWPQTGNVTDRLSDGGFHISPTVIRVTILAKSEVLSGGPVANDNSALNPYNFLLSIEDRPTLPAVQGLDQREYRTLTETFRPKNTTWRDPQVP